MLRSLGRADEESLKLWFRERSLVRKGVLMAEPIVFAKCDPRPGQEALVLIYRPDRSTTKGEKQIRVRARSLDQETLSEMESFVHAARLLLERMARAMRDKPHPATKRSASTCRPRSTLCSVYSGCWGSGSVILKSYYGKTPGGFHRQSVQLASRNAARVSEKRRLSLSCHHAEWEVEIARKDRNR